MNIVVRCPDCSETRVSPADVTLRMCVDDDSWSYRFRCPSCGCRTVSPTNRWRALDALVVGVSVEHWNLPAELLERREGPPLTLSDLRTVQAALARPDWFEALARQPDP